VVEHILRHYPKASGDETWPGRAQKLIAFLLGVVSHSVADITWHDIATAEYIQQGMCRVACVVRCVVRGSWCELPGFIQALAEADYYVRNSSYSGTEHSEADAGGEFMAAYELDLSFLSDTWCVHSSFFLFRSFPFRFLGTQSRRQLNAVALHMQVLAGGGPGAGVRSAQLQRAAVGHQHVQQRALRRGDGHQGT
jgi:hypothetical protein